MRETLKWTVFAMLIWAWHINCGTGLYKGYTIETVELTGSLSPEYFAGHLDLVRYNYSKRVFRGSFDILKELTDEQIITMSVRYAQNGNYKFNTVFMAETSMNITDFVNRIYVHMGMPLAKRCLTGGFPMTKGRFQAPLKPIHIDVNDCYFIMEKDGFPSYLMEGYYRGAYILSGQATGSVYTIIKVTHK